MKTRAFTMIELIVVLFFMVVAAAMVIPRYGPFQRAGQARDAARNVASMVREARVLAVEKQRAVTVQLDPARHAFVLTYDDSLIVPASQMATPTGSSTGGPLFSSMDRNDQPPVQSLPIPPSVQVQLQSQAPLIAPAPNPNGGGGQAAAPAGAQPATIADGNSLTFYPDGRAYDADILIAYGAGNGLRVAVRRQGTQVSVTDASQAGTTMAGSPL